MSHKILVIDDDFNICELLKRFLSKEDFEIVTTQNGNEGLVIFKIYEPDLVLLDIMIPEKDNLVLWREIFSKPIIILTEKDEEFDKFLNYEIDADDFIIKPFDAKEICARIKAVLRRAKDLAGKTDFAIVKFENFEINRNRYELKINNKIVNISSKQFELLYFLASNLNRVFTRKQILEKLWGIDYYENLKIVDVNIRYLREKLIGISDKCKIKTIWGVGYKFEFIS